MPCACCLTGNQTPSLFPLISTAKMVRVYFCINRYKIVDKFCNARYKISIANLAWPSRRICTTFTNGRKAMNSPTFVHEYNAILEVLHKYNEGGAKADSSIMKPAFSDQATIFGVDAQGKLTGGPIHGLFEVIDNDFKPSPEAKCAVVRIDIVGTAASARIDTDDISGFRFTDFFNLLKVDGKWTIVSKIYHTHA